MMCDMMWFSRNQAIHKGVIPEVLKLAENIRRVSSEHIAAWSQKQHPRKATWTKPLLKTGARFLSMLSSEIPSPFKQLCARTTGERSGRF